MIGQYLLPDERITFDQLSDVADRKEGYVVWEFPVWKWLMDRGVHVADYDIIDYEAWIRDGLEGFKKSIPEEEFKWYTENLRFRRCNTAYQRRI